MEQTLTQPSSLFESIVAKLRLFTRGISVQRRQRQLRLLETLSLGDRRFLAVVMVEQEKFLVGGGVNSVSFLTRLSQPLSDRYELAPETDQSEDRWSLR